MILSEANAWACLRYPCAAQRRMAGRKDPAISSVPDWKPGKRRRQAPNRLDFPSTTGGRATPPPTGPKITPTRPANPVPDPAPGANSRVGGNPGSRPPLQARGPNTRPPPERGPSSKPQTQPGETPPCLLTPLPGSCAAPWSIPASRPTRPSAGATWARSAVTASAAAEHTHSPSPPDPRRQPCQSYRLGSIIKASAKLPPAQADNGRK